MYRFISIEMRFVVIKIFLCVISTIFSEKFCPLEYRVTDPNHSVCSTPFANVIDQPVNSIEQQLIVELHNHERRLARGTNIEKMYWNDELALIARSHARKCLFEHDKPNERSVPKFPLTTGQNLAMGYENWTEAIQGWIEEKEYYYHSYPSNNLFQHYKQMIWHSSALIGCAATICPPFGSYSNPWTFYVCNYMRGMLETNYRPAFDPTAKDHPLRDCQGKVCLYNGTLDLDTCQCQCSTYATGSQCEKLNCSAAPICSYPSSISCIAADVPMECPRLCGLCDRYEILHRMSINIEDEMTTISLEFVEENFTNETFETSTPMFVFSRSNSFSASFIFLSIVFIIT